jgi:hypothetical protein
MMRASVPKTNISLSTFEIGRSDGV